MSTFTSITSTTVSSQTGFRAFINRHKLVAFFTLSIAVTWLLALPSFLFGMPFKPIQTLGAYGPFLAALIVSVLLGGSEIKSLFRRMTNFRFGFGWYLIAIFGYVVLYLLVAGLSGAPLIEALPKKWTLIFTLYLPVLFSSYLINPIGEETGWTGFALPYLQERFSPWLAAVILGFVWAFWHLPGFFVPSEMGSFNPVNFIFFVLISIFVRILWMWITNHTGGSGIVGILLHASSNAVSLALIPSLLPAPTPNQMALSGLLLLGLLFLFALLVCIFTRGWLSYQSSKVQKENYHV